MPRNALIFVALFLLSSGAFSAPKGITSRTVFSCDSAYTLWKVFWAGAAKSSHSDLMEGKTNLNWEIKVAGVRTPKGAMAPATNLRWYRVRGQSFIPFVYSYTSMCWVPLQPCNRNVKPL